MDGMRMLSSGMFFMRVERAGDGEGIGMQVANGRFELRMAHRELNRPRISSRVQTMRRVGVAEMMRRDVQPQRTRRGTHAPLHIGLVATPPHDRARARMHAGPV